MTVSELCEKLNLRVFTPGDGGLEREVTGGYCGDLLSWVMGRAVKNGCWITIMSNVNVSAVAGLADVSCVLLCEGVEPDAGLTARAEDEPFALLGSEEDAFTLAGKLYGLL